MNNFTKIAAAGFVALGVSGVGFAVAQTAEKPAAVEVIGFDQAAAIALEAQPGMVKEIERERDDGVEVFEVEVKSDEGEFEILINAATGEILSVEEEDRWHFWNNKG